MSLATIPEGYAAVQGAAVEFANEVCGVYFQSMLVPKKGMIVGYHSHPYPHASYIGSGAARLMFGGISQGVHFAGEAVAIPAGTAHSWEALLDDTRIACVHDVASAEGMKVKED